MLQVRLDVSYSRTSFDESVTHPTQNSEDRVRELEMAHVEVSNQLEKANSDIKEVTAQKESLLLEHHEVGP